MGRRPRIHYNGAIYHVMSRGVDRRAVFVDDADRLKFLSELDRLCGETSVRVLAYCLMGNHFHLALQVADIPLSAFMQRLLTSYATYFNQRHARTGHLFEGRHLAKLCLDDAYLQRVIRYIHQNPVRAGFVSKARDWPWSSVHRFADDGSGDDFTGFDPWEGAESIAMSRGIPIPRTGMESLAKAVDDRTGVPIAAIRSGCRTRWAVAARRMFVQEAVRNGHTLTSVADWLRTTRSSIHRYLARSHPTTRLSAISAQAI